MAGLHNDDVDDSRKAIGSDYLNFVVSAYTGVFLLLLFQPMCSSSPKDDENRIILTICHDRDKL